MKQLSISLSEEDRKLIQEFCKSNGFNFSAKTVQFWKHFILKNEIFPETIKKLYNKKK